MDFKIRGAKWLPNDLESWRVVGTDVFVVRPGFSGLAILVVGKQFAVVLVGKCFINHLLKVIRILEFLGQFLQKTMGAHELNHFWHALLFVENAKINIEGTELRELHGLFDKDLLALAEGVPSA